MFLKYFTTGLVTVSLVGSVVLAAPAKKGAFEAYVARIAKETGKSEKEVREEALAKLRQSKQFNKADLERVGKKEGKFEASTEADIVTYLNAKRVESKTGLEAVRNKDISAKAEKSFDEISAEISALDAKTKDKSASKAEVAKAKQQLGQKKEALEVAKVRAEQKAKLDALSPEQKEAREQVKGVYNTAKFYAKVEAKFGKDVVDAISKVSDENLMLMNKLAGVMVDRFEKDEVIKTEMNGDKVVATETAAQFLKNVAKSPETLDGKLVVGEGSAEACMAKTGMARDAVMNYMEIINVAAREAKDAETWTRGMGRAMKEKLRLEDEEAGTRRVCQLATSGCGLLGDAIKSACSKLNMVALH